MWANEQAIKKALQHADKLGEGAKKRKHLSPENKMTTVMKERKRGTLHSWSGEKVSDYKQALAIWMSEAEKHKKK
jgi:hypothetical protein